MEQQSGLSAFIAELRRRRVFRVAAFYGGIAFVMFQIIDSIFEPLHIPEWIGSLIIILLLVGFPIAVGLAWIFDITPEGIVRTEGRSTGKPGTSNRALIAVTIAAVAFGIWGKWGGDGTNGAIRSLVVLPLDNLSNDPDQQFFVDGMHDILTSELSKVQGLTVISRNSAMFYGGKNIPTARIVQELGVDAIVEGSVLRAGERVRITVQLIDARTDKHLWSDNFDRDLVDIFALHSEVARAITEQVAATLQGGVTYAPTTTKKIDPRALDEYVRGRSLWNKRTGESLSAAITHFKAAIAYDSTSALAWSALAEAYALAPPYMEMGADIAATMTRQAAQNAISLEPGLAQPYVALGFVTDLLTEAEPYYQKAIALDPNYATAYHWYGMALFFQGNLSGAEENLNRAVALDPRSAIIRSNRVANFAARRQTGKAFSEWDEIWKIDPQFSANIFELIIAHAFAGNGEQAKELLSRFPRRTPRDSLLYRVNLAAIHTLGGDKQAALNLLPTTPAGGTSLLGIDDSRLVSALVLAALGEMDRAFEFIDAYADNLPDPRALLSIPYAWLSDSLSADPRFEALLQRYGVAN
ncbi:MAG: tetratricopeptide repeat protein [Candidatus Marinimicrobia bacterium]|nr:tetratricopeptide repeat protein [Candidatus Neomarinimicrobiota bacterium]